jgi:hypothetical protein
MVSKKTPNEGGKLYFFLTAGIVIGGIPYRK